MLLPVHVQVTVPPEATRWLAGSKELSAIETAACCGAGPSPVAVNVAGEPVAPLVDASTPFAPAVAPSAHVVEAMPAASVEELVGLTLPAPAVTVQATVLPATPFPPSVTRTTRGSDTGCPCAAV